MATGHTRPHVLHSSLHALPISLIALASIGFRGVAAQDDLPVAPEGEKGWHCSEVVCCRTSPWWLDDWFMENLPEGDACQLELQFWGYFTVAAVVFVLASLLCLAVYLTRFWTCWDPCRPCCLPCCAPSMELEYLELGTTPLFGKIGSPLGGGSMSAPSTGWKRIVPDSDVFYASDDASPLVPDYQAQNHSPNVDIYDYNSWVASLAPDTANAVHRHKELIRHDQEQEYVGHVRHIANVLGHRMLPGFTGRVVPYVSFEPPPLPQPPPPPQLPVITHAETSGEGASAVEAKQEGAVAVPIVAPTEPVAAATTAKSWWKPFGRKQQPPPPPPQPIDDQQQKVEGSGEEQTQEGVLAGEVGAGKVEAEQPSGRQKTFWKGFKRRGAEEATGTDGGTPEQSTVKRKLFGGWSKSPPKKTADEQPTDKANSPVAPGEGEGAAEEEEDKENNDVRGDSGEKDEPDEAVEKDEEDEEGESEHEEAGKEEEGEEEEEEEARGDDATAAVSPSKKGKKINFFKRSKQKKNVTEKETTQGLDEASSSGDKGDKGKAGLRSMLGMNKKKAAPAEGKPEQSSQRGGLFGGLKWGDKRGGDKNQPPSLTLPGYEGREAELERAALMGQGRFRVKKAKAEAQRRRMEARTMRSGGEGKELASPSSSMLSGTEHDDAASPTRAEGSNRMMSETGSDSEAGSKAGERQQSASRAGPLSTEIEEVGDDDKDHYSEGPATSQAPLPPPKAGLEPLAPMNAAPGGGLAPLKPTGLAPLQVPGGKGGEEGRESVKSFDSDDAF